MEWNIDRNSSSSSSSSSNWPWDIGGSPVSPNPSIWVPWKPILGDSSLEPDPSKKFNYGGLVESSDPCSPWAWPWMNVVTSDRRSYAPKALFLGRIPSDSSSNPSTASIDSSGLTRRPKGYSQRIWKDVAILSQDTGDVSEKNSSMLSRFTVLLKEEDEDQDQADAKEWSFEYTRARMVAAESRFREILIDVTRNRPGSGVARYSMDTEDYLKFDCFLSEEEFGFFMATTGRRAVVMSIVRQGFKFGPAPTEAELNNAIADITERVGSSLPPIGLARPLPCEE